MVRSVDPEAVARSIRRVAATEAVNTVCIVVGRGSGLASLGGIRVRMAMGMRIGRSCAGEEVGKRKSPVAKR
jgi:hypothetical protein